MTRRAIVIVTAAIAFAVFAAAGLFYDRYDTERRMRAAAAASSFFVRPHSPVIGPPNAPVTIVEFFDPACEACRALYPVVKQILAKYPKDVRLVIRYAPLHQGSEEAVRILEAARMQNLFGPVLEALLATQPSWAAHGAPNLNRAWESARGAGLDLARARRDMLKPEIDEVLRQDIADLRTAGVTRTPTFYVNGRPLASFGAQHLHDLVRSEVERVGGSR